MLMRRQKPLVDVPLDDEPDEELPQPTRFVDWCCLPEDELLSGETRAELDRAIRRLPEKYRLVFTLRDIEGLSIKETGEILGLTETAVKTRLLRARLQLREQLSDYFRERLEEEDLR
jgi:RNA polymerase sigma-70 factor (ECF subfamily)